MAIFYVALGFVAVIAVAAWSFTWHNSKSRANLDRWAAANGLTLLKAERRLFRRGPFFMRTAKAQAVFYVSARDASGQTRDGYVRLGSILGGQYSDQADVRWNA